MGRNNLRPPAEGGEFRLQQEDDRLFLLDGKHKLEIDFIHDKANYWKPMPRGKNELLAKAVGLHLGKKDILDATAGLLQDSFFLARLGASIRAVEKSDLIYPLLENAYTRGMKDEKTQEVLKRIHLVHSDAISFLHNLKDSERPDVIYLDPMFPNSKKTALPRLEMQIFRKVVEENTDSESLLMEARKTVKSRVVVKRPLKGEAVSAGWVHQLSGTSIRFDIYAPVS